MNLVVNFQFYNFWTVQVIFKFLFKLSLVVLWSVFVINSAIVTSSSRQTFLIDSSKKEKRGTLGFGVHGHHYPYENFNDYGPTYNHHHHHPVAPPPGPSPHPPVHLGAHAHTTVVKKVGIPVPVPYPVKVKLMKKFKENLRVGM